MGDREKILARLRAADSDPAPSGAASLPDLVGDWLVYEDRAGQFASVLEAVGGNCVPVQNEAELRAGLERLVVEVGGRTVRCEIPGLLGTAANEPVSAPHDHAELDLLIVNGDLAVAENGAVWVTGDRVGERSALFLAQHVAVVVSAASLVDNMHEAYSRIDAAATEYGVFISGPSKTADIEQALVIGAHGPRSLTVYLRI